MKWNSKGWKRAWDLFRWWKIIWTHGGHTLYSTLLYTALQYQTRPGKADTTHRLNSCYVRSSQRKINGERVVQRRMQRRGKTFSQLSGQGQSILQRKTTSFFRAQKSTVNPLTDISQTRFYYYFYCYFVIKTSLCLLYGSAAIFGR